MFASLLLMMFTPTKWTHHFGVYAGLAGSLAVARRGRGGQPPCCARARNRTLFAAAVLFLLACRFTSTNGWWYVSSYGVPWWDKPVVDRRPRRFATVAPRRSRVVMLLIAAW